MGFTHPLGPRSASCACTTLPPQGYSIYPWQDLIVDVEVNKKGMHQMNLDDLIGLGMDLPDCNNIAQAEWAPLLAILTCARPLHTNEPIPCDTMAAKKKLKGLSWNDREEDQPGLEMGFLCMKNETK